MRIYDLLILSIFLCGTNTAFGEEFKQQQLPDGSIISEYSNSDGSKIRQIQRSDGTVEMKAIDLNGNITTTTQRPDDNMEMKISHKGL